MDSCRLFYGGVVLLLLGGFVLGQSFGAGFVSRRYVVSST